MGDALPVEVIFKILSHATFTDVHASMTINRKWYTMSQQQLYKEITITVEKTDPIVHTILHSHSNPGKFVFKINIHSLAIPANFTISALDTIDLLMIQCPNVTEIEFNHELSIDEWNYFSVSLCSRHNSWQLKNIIYPFPFSKSTWIYYKRCTATMTHSLQHLYIGSTAFNTENGGRDLFHSLTSLTIKPGVIQSLVECGDTILRFTPNLKEVHAIFKNQKDSKFQSDRQNLYPTIRALNLTYDGTLEEEDLLFIMYKFRTLENLQLKFNGAQFIRDNLFQSVIQYVTALPRYKLEIYNNFEINNCVLLLEKYYTSVNKSSRMVDIYYENNTDQSIRCSLHHQSENMNLTFVRHSLQYADTWYMGYVTSKILTDEKISMHFETLHFHLEGDKLNPYVVQNIHRLSYTKKLIFTRGKITAGPLHESSYNLSVDAIELNECDVSGTGCLYHFLSFFHRVSLNLTHCRLPTLDGGELQLFLPPTVCDTLYLNFASPVYVRIKFSKNDYLYFFVDDFKNMAYNLSQCIDEQIYNQHLRMQQCNVIFIHIEAINLKTIMFDGYGRLDLFDHY